MKTIFLTVSLLMIASFSQADEWPYDPTCRRYFASSETVITYSNPPEKIVLCKFGVKSYVDKGSLGRSMPTWVVRAYADNTEFMGRPCTAFGGMIVQAKDSRGMRYQLCRFLDRSYMEQDTFQEGPESAFNYEMNQALMLDSSF